MHSARNYSITMELEEVIDVLHTLASDPSQRLATLERLLAELTSQALRDLTPSSGFYDAVLNVLPVAWHSFESEALRRLNAWVRGVLALPEFAEGEVVRSAAGAAVTVEFVEAALERMAALKPTEVEQSPASLVRPAGMAAAGGTAAAQAGGDAAAELATLQALLHWAYREAVPVRPAMRAALGTALLEMSAGPVPPPALRAVLELLAAIIAGFDEPTAAHRRLLADVLVPLHMPSERLDAMTPVLSLYHEGLVQCVVRLLTRQPALVAGLLQPLLASWPQPREGNSAKEVLLLHEVEAVLELAPPPQQPRVALLFAPRLAACVASENSRLAERGLSVFSREAARAVLLSDVGAAATLLLPSLVRGFAPHWNQTVNKMSHEVLSLMRAAGPTAFATAAEQLYGESGFLGAATAADAPPPPQQRQPPPQPPGALNPQLAAAAASAGPPSSHMPMRAPWAARGAPGGGGGGGGGAMAATPIGVATVRPGGGGGKRFDAVSRMPGQAVAPQRTAAGGAAPQFTLDLGQVSEAAGQASCASATVQVGGGGAGSGGAGGGGGDGDGGGSAEGAAPVGAGLARVLRYMESIKPAEGASSAAPPASVKEHLTEAPMLLPSIIFQDLVFGGEIGSGSFSTVRYCKHVQRGVAASAWPEYAAKTIRSQLMSELGYEGAVRREIAVLRLLTHPGVARLVSSFRWKADVYLLLEYAARGDLHGQLRRFGSVALPNAQFIFAELSDALRAVHSLGFAFGDLKPENILLSASGHAKLTDFGAARPLAGHTGAAAALANAGDVLLELRDGDWRAKRQATAAPEDSREAQEAAAAAEAAEAAAEAAAAAAATAGEAEEDTRLEGTALYLSPELVRGGQPSVASDCWALGCTIYQALCGKPPVWAETEAEVMRRIVRFASLETEGRFPAGFDADARALVTALLEPSPERRLGGGADGIVAVQRHAFFSGVGDPAALYQQTPPPLKGGVAPPNPHAAWTRRHNSMMWSPLPQRYAFGEDEQPLAAVPETAAEANAPFAHRGLGSLAEAPLPVPP